MSDRDILRDDDGIALTEYLSLLGILVGAAILAVASFGGTMSAKWESWSRFSSALVAEQSAAGVTAVLAAAEPTIAPDAGNGDGPQTETVTSPQTGDGGASAPAKPPKDKPSNGNCVERSKGACTASNNHD